MKHVIDTAYNISSLFTGGHQSASSDIRLCDPELVLNTAQFSIGEDQSEKSNCVIGNPTQRKRINGSIAHTEKNCIAENSSVLHIKSESGNCHAIVQHSGTLIPGEPLKADR